MVKKTLDRSAVYSALLTPYDKHGELNVTVLRKLVRHEADSGISRTGGAFVFCAACAYKNGTPVHKEEAHASASTKKRKERKVHKEVVFRGILRAKLCVSRLFFIGMPSFGGVCQQQL